MYYLLNFSVNPVLFKKTKYFKLKKKQTQSQVTEESLYVSWKGTLSVDCSEVNQLTDFEIGNANS